VFQGIDKSELLAFLEEEEEEEKSIAVEELDKALV